MTSAYNEQRIRGLDGLRGVAILMVMGAHYWGLPFGLFARTETLWVDRQVHHLFGLGWMGVDLFFVLSGFLITGILVDARGKGGYFGSFYGRRALRIAPVYVLFLLFVLLVVPRVPSDGFRLIAQADALREQQLWFWTYTVNIKASLQSVDTLIPVVHGHFWSLAVEEQFYLLWPLVVLVAGRQRLAWVCVALVAGAFLFRVAIVQDATGGVFNANAANVMMPSKADALALGGLIALAWRRPDFGRVARWAPVAFAVAAGVLTVMFVARDGLRPGDAVVAQWGLTCVAVACASLLVMTLDARPEAALSRVLGSLPLRKAGQYSYALYVVHLLVGFEIARQFAVRDWVRTAGGSHMPLNAIFVAVASGVAFVIAAASWHILEERVLRLKSRFPYGPRVAPGEAGAADGGPAEAGAVVPAP